MGVISIIQKNLRHLTQHCKNPFQSYSRWSGVNQDGIGSGGNILVAQDGVSHFDYCDGENPLLE